MRPSDPQGTRKSAFELDTRPLSELVPREPFWKGTCLGVQGEPCTQLHIIAEGQVLLSRRSPEGDNYAVHLLGPGEVVGIGALRPEGKWLVTARAVTDGATHRLSMSQLPRLAQHYPQLTIHLLGLLGARLERTLKRVDLIARPSAHARVLGLLRLLADSVGQRHGDESWIPLALTQAELGEMVGLARETITRVLAELEQEGVIRRTGRRGLWLRLALMGSQDAEQVTGE